MEILTIEQIKTLSNTEIQKKILEVQQNLFDLKFKHMTKKSIKTHFLKKYRRMLAQLLTIEMQLK